MFHDLDGLVPGTFVGAIWFISVAAWWLVWRLIPRRWQRTWHVLRIGLLLWIVAGAYFAVHLYGFVIAGLLGVFLVYHAIHSFPLRRTPRLYYLPRWQRVLRIGTKALVLLIAMLAFLSLAYLSAYAWFATPSPTDFASYVEPGSRDAQSKAGYLFFWLIGPLAVLLAALGEWFRRPLCEDSLSRFEYYWRAVFTVLLAVWFAWDAYDNPQRAIRAAQAEGYALSQPLPCFTLLMDCHTVSRSSSAPGSR